jgi:hypothetical protein
MIQFPVEHERFEKLVKISKDHNIFPIFYDRYLEESPYNDVPEFGKMLNEIYNDLIFYFDNFEIHQLKVKFEENTDMCFWYGEFNKLSKDEVVKAISLDHIVTQSNKIYRNIEEIINLNLKTSRIFEIYPELIHKIDKDGLICIDDDFEIVVGGIFYKNHFLYFHQFLRREYFSNPNYDFISLLAEIHKLKSLSIRIAIDFSRIIEKKDFREYSERDTWYGVNFKEENLDSNQCIEATVLSRNIGSIFRTINNIERTEFFWKIKGAVKSSEIEELRSLSSKIQGFILNRYCHSERDIKRKIFQHFDGAIKIYREDEYPIRLDKVGKKMKSNIKIKLFRVDGSLATQDWIMLLTSFFKSNEMIIEYFDPETFEKEIKSKEFIK